MELVDARGKPCPKPVMMAKKAIDESSGSFRILVDSMVSATNVRRFVESRGYKVNVTEETTGDFLLECIMPETGLGNAAPAAGSGRRLSHGEERESVMVLVTSSLLGNGDKPLGDVLMKGFLSALSESGAFTGTVALMNRGVFLTLRENSASESLRSLEAKGCPVLVCGTCTNHYGITEKVSVGTISNMFEITEALVCADRTVTIP